MRRSLFALALTVGVLAGCRPAEEPAPPPPPEPEPPASAEEALKPVSARVLRELVDDFDGDSLRFAVERNLDWLSRQPGDREFVYGPRTVTAARLVRSLERFDGWLEAGLSPQELAARLADGLIRC